MEEKIVWNSNLKQINTSKASSFNHKLIHHSSSSSLKHLTFKIVLNMVLFGTSTWSQLYWHKALDTYGGTYKIAQIWYFERGLWRYD